ncbi:EamA-like transporter family protein [Cognatiyoonia koreensis]|uniref:EamA-like transporter family protein n=1 Tax=Cognatiyoonia koreensis TaxID=364200 RepID=A0A1I0P1D5_9RHOB|nr:DMT family transporter [Cognatiyoonia koreensis]SEW08151.1 EamA-like transporter family protein [Cognatiyoonia koreensis]
MPVAETTRAAIWMIGAIISFSAMTIAGRQVSFALDTFEIMLFRSITGIAIVLAIGAAAGTLSQINRVSIGLHFTRNLTHFVGQNLWFYALPLIPLAQLFALEFTSPIWVILLSPLILGERITRIGAFSAALGFCGVLLVAQPGSGPITPALLSAAGCAVFFALTAIFTRRLTRSASITCIMFYLTVMQAVFGLICAGYDGDITLPSATTAPWLIVIGIAGLAAHFCLTTALSLAPASFVMPIDFVRLPTIALIGMFFYNEPLSMLVVLGAAVIIFANYINIRYGARR